MLRGSGVVLTLLLPRMVNDSEGTVPKSLSEARDGPLFSSHTTGLPSTVLAFDRFNQ